MREPAPQIELEAVRRTLAALVTQQIFFSGTEIAEGIAHIQENVLEHRHRGGCGFRQIDLGAGTRLDAGLEAAP